MGLLGGASKWDRAEHAQDDDEELRGARFYRWSIQPRSSLSVDATPRSCSLPPWALPSSTRSVSQPESTLRRAGAGRPHPPTTVGRTPTTVGRSRPTIGRAQPQSGWWGDSQVGSVGSQGAGRGARRQSGWVAGEEPVDLDARGAKVRAWVASRAAHSHSAERLPEIYPNLRGSPP